MKIIITILGLILVIFLLIKGIINIKNQSESKLSIFEHPGTFKKSEIENSKSNIEEEKIDNSTFYIDLSD